MSERAVYNSEDGKWYRQGDDPWVVRLVPKGSVLKPLVFAIADTYGDAFQQLFGHPVLFPVSVYSHRHVVLP